MNHRVRGELDLARRPGKENSISLNDDSCVSNRWTAVSVYESPACKDNDFVLLRKEIERRGERDQRRNRQENAKTERIRAWHGSPPRRSLSPIVPHGCFIIIIVGATHGRH